MARKQTAEQLTENATALIEQIRAAAVNETRDDFATAFAKLASCTERVVRAAMGQDKRPVTDDFRAGIAFAAELLADRQFDA